MALAYLEGGLMPRLPSRVALHKKFTHMIILRAYYYLLDRIVPLELLTKINPNQVGAN